MQSDNNLVPVRIASDVTDADGNVILHAGDVIYVPAPKGTDPADDVVVNAGSPVYVARDGSGAEDDDDPGRDAARAFGRALGKAGRAAGTALAATGKVATAVGSAAIDAAGTVAGAAGSAVKKVGETVRDRSQAKGVPEAVAEETAEFSEEQSAETEKFARKFIRKLLRVGVVRINREHFLSTELRNKGVYSEQIERAIQTRPAEARIPRSTLDQIANEAIELEVRMATSASFVAGLPGGWAIFATIPVDITQYYAHVFRLIQKLAYVYGWPSFLDELDEVSDETLNELIMFLGVALGVEGAGTMAAKFAVKVAQPAVAKHVAAMTLTKTVWYPVLKKVLNFVGVSITKNTVGKAAGMAVPVVGGFVCGGLTFATLGSCGRRLKKHLSGLPQADPNMEARAKQMAVEYEIEDHEIESLGHFRPSRTGQ